MASSSDKGCILVTGGAGFIGSHTCVELLDAGYDVVVVDDLSNASEVALKRVEKIAGRPVRAFYRGDVRDDALLDRILDEHPVVGAIHFAAFKAVGESVHKPIEYYQNNLGGTLELARALRDHGVRDIVFSSSATVYGDPDAVPVTEESPLKPATNPYGRTKSMNEQMLRDLYTADPSWNVMLLRYFNPIGAHPSGLIGEDPKGIPNNLVPYVAKVAIGQLACVQVFGDDYPTPTAPACATTSTSSTSPAATSPPSTTCAARRACTCSTWERATATACSTSSRRSAGRAAASCPTRSARAATATWPRSTATPRRRSASWAGKARYGIDDMCADAWRWQSMNPNGYVGATE